MAGQAPGLPGAGLLAHGPGVIGPGAGILGHGPGVLGHGHFPGHPITHPGFSTLGFPGHAQATLDIKVSGL